MRPNIVRFISALLLVVIMAPQAFAQDTDEQEHEKKEAFEAHYHLGTMTPPDQETMDIKYMMSMDDGEHMAWLVFDADGAEVKVEMMDLEMNEGVVSYSWSPPDADMTISCELESDDDGGWAGDCLSDSDEGGIGQMTMGPMMNHDSDSHADHESDEDKHAEHDDDDDGDSVPVEDDGADS